MADRRRCRLRGSPGGDRRFGGARRGRRACARPVEHQRRPSAIARCDQRDRRWLAAAHGDTEPSHRVDRSRGGRHVHDRRRPRGPGRTRGRSRGGGTRRRRRRGAPPAPDSIDSWPLRGPGACLDADRPLPASHGRRGSAADGTGPRGSRVPAIASAAVIDHRRDDGPRSEPGHADAGHGLVQAQVHGRRRQLRPGVGQPPRARPGQRGAVLGSRKRGATPGHGDVDARRGDRRSRRQRRSRLRERHRRALAWVHSRAGASGGH